MSVPQRPVELLEPLGVRRVGRRADAAGVDHAHLAVAELDHAEAADGRSGVDSERDHPAMVATRDHHTRS